MNINEEIENAQTVDRLTELVEQAANEHGVTLIDANSWSEEAGRLEVEESSEMAALLRAAEKRRLDLGGDGERAGQ